MGSITSSVNKVERREEKHRTLPSLLIKTTRSQYMLLITPTPHILNKLDKMEKKAMFHLEKAAELGNCHAQNMIANILASGILPFEDHPALSVGIKVVSMDLLCKYKLILQRGGDQLARTIILWHLSAMAGNIGSCDIIGLQRLHIH